MDFKGRSIVSIKDLTKEEILHILKIAEKFEKKHFSSLLNDKVMGTLFFEPSTRTRLSFESAMKQLGGGVIGFSEPGMTSIKKGETLWDTIKMVTGYTDVIVMRHPLEGSARVASESANVPVINGGDGANQHPSQTLLDLYSIKKTQGKLNISIAMVGDLKYGRTVHSLASALALFNAKMYFVSPDSLKMPRYILEELDKKGIKYSQHKKVEEVIRKVDILYSTRIQQERFPDPAEYEKVKNVYILSKNMFKGVRKNLKIMHPLPRVNEIKKDVDELPYAYYFEQAENGIPVRKAIVSLVLGKIK